MTKFNLVSFFILLSVLTHMVFAQRNVDIALHIVQDTDALFNSQLYSAYKIFKEKKFDEVTALMAEQAFQKQVGKTVTLENGNSVDSLVFLNSSGSKIILTMVDLGYIKVVNGIFNLIVEDSKQDLDEFQYLLVKDGLIINDEWCNTGSCVEFLTTDEYWIIEKGFQELTYTKYTWLYDHVMSTYGDNQFSIHFKEMIPEEWVTSEEVPANYFRKMMALSPKRN